MSRCSIRSIPPPAMRRPTSGLMYLCGGNYGQLRRGTASVLEEKMDVATSLAGLVTVIMFCFRGNRVTAATISLDVGGVRG